MADEPVWEYYTVCVRYKKVDSEWDWTATIDDSAVVGEGNILNHYGQRGWELVTIVPDYTTDGKSIFPNAKLIAYQLMYYFKRRLS